MGIVPKFYHIAYLVDMGLEKRMAVLFIITDKVCTVHLFNSMEQLNGYSASLIGPISGLKLLSKKDVIAEIGKLQKEDERLAGLDLSPLKEKLLI